MITILVVGPPDRELSEFAAVHPSLEIVLASGPDEALERLARNRRIDAVLLLPGTPARDVAEAIAEEDPGAPPVFAPWEAGRIAGVETAPESFRSPAELAAFVTGKLSPEAP